jgi:excisionase family DNA binding protein
MKNSSHEDNGTYQSKGTRAHVKITKGVRAIGLGRLLDLLKDTYRKESGHARDHERNVEWLTVKELASYCGISERKLRDLIRKELPHVKVGRLVRISRTAFDAWMLTQSRPVRAPAPPVPTVGLLDRIRASRPTPRRKFLVDDRTGLRDHRAHDHVVQFNRRRCAS